MAVKPLICALVLGLTVVIANADFYMSDLAQRGEDGEADSVMLNHALFNELLLCFRGLLIRRFTFFFLLFS